MAGRKGRKVAGVTQKDEEQRSYCQFSFITWKVALPGNRFRAEVISSFCGIERKVDLDPVLILPFPYNSLFITRKV